MRFFVQGIQICDIKRSYNDTRYIPWKPVLWGFDFVVRDRILLEDPNFSLKDCGIEMFDTPFKSSFLTDLCIGFHPLFTETKAFHSLVGDCPANHHSSWMLASLHSWNNILSVFGCFLINFVKMFLNSEEDVLMVMGCLFYLFSLISFSRGVIKKALHLKSSKSSFSRNIALPGTWSWQAWLPLQLLRARSLNVLIDTAVFGVRGRPDFDFLKFISCQSHKRVSYLSLVHKDWCNRIFQLQKQRPRNRRHVSLSNVIPNLRITTKDAFQLPWLLGSFYISSENPVTMHQRPLYTKHRHFSTDSALDSKIISVNPFSILSSTDMPYFRRFFCISWHLNQKKIPL